ncbi:MAG: RimK family alpha-L-glutamate ligase [Burkholderiales bacterium]|nr:RimK family alpha-L-glutamate ligase [Burkholderiales bacterium]
MSAILNTPSTWQALVDQPERLGLARLMTLAFEGHDLMPIAQRLIERASSHAEDADTLMSLSIALQLRGLRDEGLAVQADALRIQRLFQRPAASTATTGAAGAAPGLRLLALMAPGDLMTNTPLDFLLERSDVCSSHLYLGLDESLPARLPAHDVLLVAISESDRTRPLLQRLGVELAVRGLPVINRPDRIVQTGRTEAFRHLQGLPGVLMPATARLSLADLKALARGDEALARWLPGAAFPVIVRPVDSHAGQGLAKVSSPRALGIYLDEALAGEFFVSPFVDYASADGAYRKYRVVLVDGVAYPGHMGISSHWMIHYLNAGMTDSAAKRLEEAAFMSDFDIRFGRRHAGALQAVGQAFGLEYLVIDCAETRAGELLVFELDPGAVIHAMDPPTLFPYKRPQMERVFAAFRRLLGSRADRVARAGHANIGHLSAWQELGPCPIQPLLRPTSTPLR